MFSTQHVAPERLSASKRLNLLERRHLRNCVDCQRLTDEVALLRSALASLPELPFGLTAPARFDAWRLTPAPAPAPSPSRRLVLRLGSIASAAAGALLLISSLGMPMASSGGAQNLPAYDDAAELAAPSVSVLGETPTSQGARDLTPPVDNVNGEATDPLPPLGGLLLLAGVAGIVWSIRLRPAPRSQD